MSRVLAIDGWERGAARSAILKALRRDVVDPPIAAHGGRMAKTTGDGLLLEFSTSSMPCAAWPRYQTVMADRNAAMPEDKRIAFRIGVNLGDIIIIDGDDIFGDGVNIAASGRDRRARWRLPVRRCLSSDSRQDRPRLR